ncbi:diguanylate cyclase (GGDEF)-like protein [Devosia subaequoris]|uniref:diguanylate cyclase n=1 Tax=Devosia subaequoris TaxID=395930 RepID=A0A7W6INV1_9HYPH|nr:GGDEF domain-containing protein [Devosia subaequoris]MBB4052465.1 diguanylate cyclase (GGDEF)-like protein [Devosia subaequoris]MCP1209625.1 GGDEF domain-containing protein [Devosia subaequoris]
MSAAAFVLTINLFIAGIFATAFGVVAAYQRSALGARWLAFAYGLGAPNVVLEFVLPFQDDHRLVSFGIFAVFLLALAGCVVGLAHHYRIRPPWLLLAVAILASLLVNIAILEMPRASFLRNLLYQAPYALVQAIGLGVILAIKRKRALDLALLAIYFISTLHFLAKPTLAMAIGSGAVPQAYMSSTYAAVSQTLGAVLLIANGLMMLLIIVRDVMADMTARSETDTLSNLLNRRGFEDRGESALALAARSGVPAVMIVADLDYFKQINDTYGHAAGDNVIAVFARILEECAAPHAVLGRLGGEEFGAFLPGANLTTGKLYAETVRHAFRSLPAGETGLREPASASLGVAQLMPYDHLADLLRRADGALYEAKNDGRDCVRMAMPAAARQPEGARLAGRRDRFSS